MGLKIKKNNTGLTNGYLLYLYKVHGADYITARFGDRALIVDSTLFALQVPAEARTHYQNKMLYTQLGVPMPNKRYATSKCNNTYMDDLYGKLGSFRAVSDVMGVSRQRVHQLAKSSYLSDKTIDKISRILITHGINA